LELGSEYGSHLLGVFVVEDGCKLGVFGEPAKTGLVGLGYVEVECLGPSVSVDETVANHDMAWKLRSIFCPLDLERHPPSPNECKR
jgi:hypothetical protein